MDVEKKINYGFVSFITVLIFIIVKIILSHFIGLGNDESYYWTYAEQLQINYFDHPPIIALWIKIFTLNLWLDDFIFFLRLGSFVGCALSAYFMYKLVTMLSTARAGWIAVVLYNCSLYASLNAGLMVMPDAPQMVFFTASLYAIVLIIKHDKKKSNWLWFGLLSGLAIMSKVHAVFLWVGVVGYAILYARQWLTNWLFYAAMGITALVISPILIWNIQYDFITFRFHGDRVKVGEQNVIHWYGLLKELVGQLIINNPINVVISYLFIFYPPSIRYAKGATKLFILIAAPLLLCIIYLALFKEALPHWSGPVYVCLIPIAAIGLSQVKYALGQGIIKTNLIYTFFVLVGLVYAIQFYPGTFGNSTLPQYGKNDISLDAFGWQEAGAEFKKIYEKNCDANKQNKSPIICNTWWGAHDEFYFAKPLQAPTIGLGKINEIHHYYWRNAAQAAKAAMDTGFCLVHSYDYYDAISTNKQYYHKVDGIATITITRGNKPAYYFYVYRLIGFKNNFLF